MRKIAIWIVILAGGLGGCASGDYYRGRVLLAPDTAQKGTTERLGSSCLSHGNYVRGINYSPDGKMIASWGHDMRCRFWGASSGRLIWATPQGWYRMPIFSPDGKHVAMAYGTDVHLVSLDSGKVVRTFRNHRREITWIGFAHAGGRLVTISNDRTIRLWHVGLGWETRKIELGRVGVQSLSTAGISGDGKLMALVTDYSGVRLYNLDSGRLLRTLKPPKPAWPQLLVFSDDNKKLYCELHDSQTLFWDVADGQICDGAAPISRKGAFDVSPDGRTVAHASGGRIRLEDVSTGLELPVSAALPRCNTAPEVMVFPTPETLVTASATGVWRWDVKTGRDRLMIANSGRGDAKYALSGDGRLAALPDTNGLVSVYNVATAKRVALIEPDAEKITNTAFSDDSKTLITSSRDSISLWSMPSGVRKKVIKLPKKKYLSLTSLTLSRDGKTLAAAITQPNPRLMRPGYRKLALASHALPATVRCIEIFDVATGKSRGRIDGWLFALSPDSRTLITTDYNRFELWDIVAMKPIKKLEGSGGGAASRMLFSPDGRKIAISFVNRGKIGERISDQSGCVELIDLDRDASKTVKVLKVDDIASAPVAAFSKDSRTLAAAGASGVILLWDFLQTAEINELRR
ncbi:MAG: WD40 repeat domain-containing protein [Phycisphaerales bacterium]|jgi:WD40 repeat protein|nr:WD40 repeat domain-containing protein [Phycisphaerales bacterium]